MTEEDRRLLDEIQEKAKACGSGHLTVSNQEFGAFITRCGPKTMLKLVEWIERLEMEKERREALDRVFAFCEEQAIAEDAIRGAPEDVLKGAKW